MLGPLERHIQQRGSTYTVRNASGGTGGRDTPDYADDGELVGVLEQRRTPRRFTDSAGEDVESTLEIRAVPDETVTIDPVGTADGYPTILRHPNGIDYRVLDEHPEDSGVTVLSVVTD